MKFPALNVYTSVYSNTTYGPAFGNTNGYVALLFFADQVYKQAGQNFFQCNNLQVNFAYGYQDTTGEGNNALTGGNNQLLNIEVYQVQGIYLLIPIAVLQIT